MYSLYAITNPETFPKLPSNTYGLATSVFDPVLGLDTIFPPYATNNA